MWVYSLMHHFRRHLLTHALVVYTPTGLSTPRAQSGFWMLIVGWCFDTATDRAIAASTRIHTSQSDTAYLELLFITHTWYTV